MAQAGSIIFHRACRPELLNQILQHYKVFHEVPLSITRNLPQGGIETANTLPRPSTECIEIIGLNYILLRLTLHYIALHCITIHYIWWWRYFDVTKETKPVPGSTWPNISKFELIDHWCEDVKCCLSSDNLLKI